MRGSLVIARDYKSQPLVRRVWESGRKVVYLCEETQFQRLSTGMDGLKPIGFPAEDVFDYDPSAEEAMRIGTLDWSVMRRFDALSQRSMPVVRSSPSHE